VKRKNSFFQDYGVLLAFVVLFAINIATRGGTFLQAENLRNLVSQSASVGIVAIGMTFVIITAGIDLSVGSMVAFCGAAVVLTLNKFAGSGDTTAILLAFGAAIGIGLLAGLVQGAIVAYGRVAAFVVTLAGMAAFRSLALVLGNGGEIRSNVAQFQEIGFGGVPIPVIKSAVGAPVVLYWSLLVFIALALLAEFILAKTRFGRYVIAVGANEKAAQYSAIDTRKVKVAVYGLIGVTVGISAFFLAARQNSVGSGSAGLYYELDAIAAVVIGGTSLRGGRGRIWGTVVGVILLTLISNMMTAYQIDTNWQGLVRGLVILVAVLLQRGSKSSE
jgi:ribose transport system permease protein